MYQLTSYHRYVDSMTGGVVVEERWGRSTQPCQNCTVFKGEFTERLARCAFWGAPCGGLAIEWPYVEPEGEYKLTPQDEINNGQMFFGFDKYHYK
jgi:hypothetical protein